MVERVEHKHFATKSIHAGQTPDKITGAVMTPIYASSTFKYKEPFEIYPGSTDYTRDGNPTRDRLETCIAELEYCKYGLCFPSGVSVVRNTVSLVKKGDHVICIDQAYGGTLEILRDVVPDRYGIEVSFVDFRDLQALKKAFKDNTKMVFFESPTNPLLRVIDIEETCKIAKEHNCLTVFDNTFMSPYLCNPVKLGVDIVWQSASKYISGHSDILMGVSCTNNKELYDKLKAFRNMEGPCSSAFDSYLALRGVKTMKVRLEQHMENAIKIAEWLQNHPHVEQVMYPGLESHEGNEIAKKQCRGRGGSGVMSFYLRTDKLSVTKDFVSRCKIFVQAPSLGAVESLIVIAVLGHQRLVPKAERVRLGITDNLVRLSIGIEDADDLIRDLEGAFEAFNDDNTQE